MKKTFICFMMILLAGCASDKPTKFYSLVVGDNSRVAVRNVGRMTVGIDTVSIPGYLERPQIVTLLDGNEVNVAEFERWAEPLANSVQRIVASNMSGVLKNAVVKPLGVNRRSLDYVVGIEINQFDGKFGNKAVLDVWWNIANSDNKLLANEHSTLELQLPESGYHNLVQKQSELLNMLSLDIAAKIKRLSGRPQTAQAALVRRE